MAKPRVFISSTFYDLRHIRSELESFIKNIGYEPVMNERGHIAYGRSAKPEKYCYQEIPTCDVVVSIIGGKFGSTSDDQHYSISQRELKEAIEANKQVYIFIDKAVHAEHKTFLANEGKDIKFAQVDDVQVHKYIKEIQSLPNNNAIFPFEIGQEIITILREQLAGLFKRLLEQEEKRPERDAIADVRAAATSLKQLVGFLIEERRNPDKTVLNILLMNHPIFRRLQSFLSVPYRVFFTSLGEMEIWLDARGWKRDIFMEDNDNEYVYSDPAESRLLVIRNNIFESNGDLKPLLPDEWDDNMAQLILPTVTTELEDPFADE